MEVQRAEDPEPERREHRDRQHRGDAGEQAGDVDHPRDLVGRVLVALARASRIPCLAPVDELVDLGRRTAGRRVRSRNASTLLSTS